MPEHPRPPALSSRLIIRLASHLFWLYALLAEAVADVTLADLPVGSAPPALGAPWLPDPAHAVVWRNWTLVEPERIARVLETDVETVRAMARSLGLPGDATGAHRMARQGAITLIRRNWHLLPYEQMLELLGWTPAQLAFSLREDDFLYVKLGSLKPRCERVRYQEPDGATARRVAAVRALVEESFPAAFSEPREPPFAFVEELSRSSGAAPAGVPFDLERARVHPRYIYSYFGGYGDPLAEGGVDPYPDGLLERLAAQGVNGVWLHVVLRQLAPGGKLFPDAGDGHAVRLARLRELVERAARHGVGIWLYLNEPRAMPATFFAGRPELAGVREGDYATLCTSQPMVRAWLSGSAEHIFREVPGLAGAFTITASENLTSCASHYRQAECPRCKERLAGAIYADVNAALAEGARRACAGARVIAWDWGWNGHGDSPEIIALLPKGIFLLSVSEWAKELTRGGVSSRVGEYSLSVVGPGPRALRHWALARERGLGTLAKVQLGTTWELASVPFLPALDLVAEHCQALARASVDGMMLSWTVGGYPSPNLRVAALYAEDPAASPEALLDRIATERLGEASRPDLRGAWTDFSEALREYPHDGAVLYNGPQQMGPANPLWPRPTGYHATMVGLPYDDLDGWRGRYPPEVFAEQFARVADGWARGLRHLDTAVAAAPSGLRAVGEADARVARAAGIAFASVANQARFVLLRGALAAGGMQAPGRAELLARLRALVDDEARLARALFALAWRDARLGFEASNHYFYTPLDLVEKVVNCQWVLEELEGGRP